MEVILRALVLLSLLSIPAFADPAPDCRYAGSGTLFLHDKATGKYQPDLRGSYQTSALRIPQGNGKYFLQQTKVFNDGRPTQRLSPRRDVYVGAINGTSQDGKVITEGYCSRIGHCFGLLKGPGLPGEMNFTLDYNADGIRYVMMAVSGDFFVDEILNADEPCEFKP